MEGTFLFSTLFFECQDETTEYGPDAKKHIQERGSTSLLRWVFPQARCEVTNAT